MSRCFFLLIAIFICLSSCNRQGARDNEPGSASSIDSLIQWGKAAEQDNYNRADSLFRQALSLASRTDNDSAAFKAYRHLLFNAGLLKGNFDSGMYWGRQALDFATTRPQFMAGAYSSMAMLYHAHQQTDSAAAYYQKAISLAEAANDTEELAPLYNNISGLYSLLGNNQLAKEYLDQYVRLAGRDTAALVGAYSNLSIYCVALNDFSGAASYLRTARNMLLRYPSSDAAPQLYSNLADQAYRQQQYDSAGYFAQLRLQSANALNDTLSMIKSRLILVDALRAQASVVAAGAELDTLQLLAKSFPPPVYIARDAARAAYMLYKVQGNTGKAFGALEKFSALDSAIGATEKSKELQAFERSRETAKAEKKILTQQLQVNERNSAIQLLAIAMVLLLALVAGIILRSRKQRAMAEKRLQYVAAQAEWNRAKASLEAQLEERNRISRELHDDLGTSLTSIALAGNIIRSKAPEAVSREVSIISDTAADMVQTLNEIVWALNSRNDSLLSLLAYIRKFAAGFLEKAGIGFSMAELPEGTNDAPVESTVRRSLYLACKEAIHNIVKHSGAKEVRLEAALGAGLLRLTIIDDGRGIDKTNSAGNGLLNMKKALEAMGGTCNIDGADGTKVTLACRITASVVHTA